MWKISADSEVGAYWDFTVRAHYLRSLLCGKRGLSFSIVTFTGVGFHSECLVVGFFVCLFSLGTTALFRDNKYLFQNWVCANDGNMYWDGLYPAHCRPLNVMLMWWEAPVVFRALKKKEQDCLTNKGCTWEE